MADSQAVIDEQQEELAFDKVATTTPTPSKVPAQTEAPKVEVKTVPTIEPKPAKVAPVVEPVVPKPEYVRLTKEQFARLDSSAAKTVEIEKQISKLFGTTGDIQQIVKNLQSVTPKGDSIELPDDVVSEMETDFPELAAHVKSALEKALKGKRGTGTAPAPGLALEEAQKLIDAATVKLQIEALEDDHPTWRTIVGAVDSQGKFDAANPFRIWLGKQSAEYQHKINSTNSSAIISKAIDKFVASTTKPAAAIVTTPRAAAQRDRIRAAIQPQGDGGQPTPASNTVEDAFNEGFRKTG